MKYSKYIFLILTIVGFWSCQKADTYENPYEGGKEALGIVFSNASLPVPSEGLPGTSVTFAATGLLKYKDKITFEFNGEAGQILSVTDNEVVVKVPESAGSGSVSISIDNQVFFGPQFKVLGKVSSDPFFKATLGANAEVMSVLVLADGRRILTGSFSDYNGEASDISPVRSIVLTAADGEIDKSFRFGRGAKDFISSIIISPNRQRFYVGGLINTYDKLSSFINNITSTLANGTGDSIKVNSYSTQFTGLKYVSAPVFNGGTNAAILKLFNSGDKVIAVGNFTKYMTRDYANGRTITRLDINGNPVYTYKDSITIDSIDMKQLIRFNPDGSLDKSYHFNMATDQSLEGGNGRIVDACQLPDGKIVAVGAFSRFDGQAAGRIVRLNLNGTVDETFNVGTGANAAISSVSFNPINRKYLITGSFGIWNGVPVKSMVMLNEDGSLDNSFVAKDFASGFPSFAKQLSNGLIIVSGGFKKYSNIKRPGFIIINADGTLAAGYNTYGDFSGSIKDILESKNAANKMSVLLIGSFNKFDGKAVKNVISITLD